MAPGRLPLSDKRREQLRNDRLWTREVHRARLLNLKQIHCPCKEYKGRRRFWLTTVREHLIRSGRDSEFRVWQGPGDRNSSDEEWEQQYWRADEDHFPPVDEQVDTRGMIHDTFEERDDPDPNDGRVQETLAEAFAVADSIHEECHSSHNWDETCISDGVDEDMATDPGDVEQGGNAHFDPQALEDAMTSLYTGTKSSTLAATILLLNLCSVHGVSNCFVDELFTILHGHILPEGNCLPRNHYPCVSEWMCAFPRGACE
jgi:hypothetical protein